jgi:hypothetical protein
MVNPTHAQIERIASETGWDSFTLLLLISRWAEEKDLSKSLIEHLADLAGDDGETDDE